MAANKCCSSAERVDELAAEVERLTRERDTASIRHARESRVLVERWLDASSGSLNELLADRDRLWWGSWAMLGAAIEACEQRSDGLGWANERADVREEQWLAAEKRIRELTEALRPFVEQSAPVNCPEIRFDGGEIREVDGPDWVCCECGVYGSGPTAIEHSADCAYDRARAALGTATTGGGEER